MLTGMYKFARHEWVGIKAAWAIVPNMPDSVKVEEKSVMFICPKSFAMCSV
jgi:hypothetical protein